MKQKLILVGVLCIFISAANAQRIGVKAGLALANAEYKYNSSTISTSNLVGIQAGLVGEIPISDDFYCSTGIFYSEKGTKVNLGVEIEYPISYLEIPLNIVYKYDLGAAKVFTQAGPFAALGLSAKMAEGDDEMEIEFGSDSGEWKPFDLGIGIGVGIEISKIQLVVHYDSGLLNISNGSNSVFTTGALTLSAGIFL